MAKKDPLPLEQRLQVNKRLTLNLFIQGAATHVFINAHYAAAEELESLMPSILAHYDRTMATMNLGYWVGSLPLLMGNPVRYFRKLDSARNPFRFHRFLLRHGRQLAEEARASVFDRARQQGISTRGFKNEFAQVELASATLQMEHPHRRRLEAIGKQVCSDIYGIEKDRLHAKLTRTPAFGKVRTPKTWGGKFLKRAMVGWSGVERRGGRLEVVAKAWIWPLLIHELVKGTVELICLHGLAGLNDGEFELVMDETEHVEYEVPMIQIGATFFQKFLAVVPRELPLAEAIMHVSRMPALILNEFLDEMMTAPESATRRLQSIQHDFLN